MGKLTQFKYEQLDGDTAQFLRTKETNMREIVGKAYTELGKELYEAQQRLAGNNQYDGVFEKWFTSLGFKKANVYRLIDRYSLVSKWDEQTQDMIEDLPVTLTYEIAKPSAESTPEKAQAKSEVLAGDIATLKEYRERIKELESKVGHAERRAEAERKERERLEIENEELAEREPEVIEKEVVKTEYVESKPDDYDYIKAELMRKERELDELSRRLADIPKTKEATTEPYDRSLDEPYQVERTRDFYRMMREVDELYKKYAHLKDGTEELHSLAKYDDDMEMKYRKADEFWRMLSNIFTTKQRRDVVDAEIIEIK